MVVNHKHSMAVSAYLTVWEISLCTCVYVLVCVCVGACAPAGSFTI